MVRYAHVAGGYDTKAAEKALRTQKINATPELVSSSSSIHPINSEHGQGEQEQDIDMMAGIRSDFVRANLCQRVVGVGIDH